MFSRISCGIPTFSLGARDDLDRFPLINAYLHCNKAKGRKYEAPGAVKLRRQVIVAELHTASASFISGLVRTDKSLFFMAALSSRAGDRLPAAIVMWVMLDCLPFIFDM